MNVFHLQKWAITSTIGLGALHLWRGGHLLISLYSRTRLEFGAHIRSPKAPGRWQARAPRSPGWGTPWKFPHGLWILQKPRHVPLGGGLGVFIIPFTLHSQCFPHTHPYQSLPPLPPSGPQGPHHPNRLPWYPLPTRSRQSKPSSPYPLQTLPVDLNFLSSVVGGAGEGAGVLETHCAKVLRARGCASPWGSSPAARAPSP